MRSLRLGALTILLAAVLAAQQAPFVPVTGPNAPQGAAFLFEDSHGGMWLGGVEGPSEGLTYFDGSRFISPVKDFPKVIVSGMAEDSEGGIWIASSGGLDRPFSGGLTRIAAGPASAGITRVGPDVFLTTLAKPGTAPNTRADLVRISETQGEWRVDTIAKSVWSYRYQLDRAGNLLYRCDAGLCELRSEDVASWHPGATLAVKSHAIPAAFEHLGGVVAKDRFGCYWLRTDLNAMYQCPGDPQPTTLPLRVAGLAQPVILELDDGSIALPGIDELAIGRPGRFRVWTHANGYPATGFALLARDGNLWLSNGNGLFLFSTRSQTEFWTERDGLDGNTWGVLPLDRNVFAIAGNSIRMLETGRDRWSTVAEASNPLHLYRGPSHTMLVGERSGRIFQMSIGGRALGNVTPAFASLLAYETDSDGHLWGCNSNGLIHEASLPYREMAVCSRICAAVSRSIRTETFGTPTTRSRAFR